jgi:hypothetical protein
MLDKYSGLEYEINEKKREILFFGRERPAIKESLEKIYMGLDELYNKTREIRIQLLDFFRAERDAKSKEEKQSIINKYNEFKTRKNIEKEYSNAVVESSNYKNQGEKLRQAAVDEEDRKREEAIATSIKKYPPLSSTGGRRKKTRKIRKTIHNKKRRR